MDAEATLTNGIQIGAYWYPWYGPDRHWEEGYLSTPVLGEYDSANPRVIAQQIDWAQRYGVDFFIASWWGKGSYEDKVIRGPWLQELSGGAFQFAVLYESPGILGVQNGYIPIDDEKVKAQILADFGYLAETYFRHPNYLRIEKKPAVFLYLTRIFTGDVASVMDEVRQVVEDQVGAVPYIVGDEVYWHTPVASRLAPFDAVTAYNMHTSVPDIDVAFADKVAATYKTWAGTAEKHEVAFIPNILPGFDDTAVRPQAKHPVIPRSLDLFEAQLKDAIELAQGPVRILTITSWNEWHEYTSIEPSEEYGVQYLERLLAVIDQE